ncbi:RlpA-like double-psi beta-barrel-protein domain-containing protein-containing protein [Dissophora ornata]|nr:hypothetical protein BGZ58_009629 [Dissophora ornata]KAI8602372.1 RlpA-like double-psi beta-barrel-protein domain-containing protein-containing protein [Dissophora ornata]
MAIFFKLAVIATAALATMVSAAPIDTTTTATTTAAAASATTGTRQTSAPMMSMEEQIVTQGVSSPYSGRGTWFTDSVGSCGTPFTTKDMIVAMNADQMQGTSQCGRTVQIRSGGKTVTARVTDTCPSQYCKPGSLDLSQAVFEKLAPLSQGVVSIQWEFV